MEILIADDEEIILLLLANILSKLGHRVTAAKTGREAWQAWETNHYPLVISDWMMPDIDGLEFCRKVRSEQRPDYTYVILLTSLSGKANYLGAMNAGADDFVTKPLQKDEFAARVQVAERILGLHAALRAMNSDLERRVAERTAELAHAMRVKSDFLSRASHELRTPMNHVLGFAQVLALDSLTPEQQSNVEQILQSGGHLLKLIDHILALSQSKAEDFTFLQPPATSSVAPCTETVAHCDHGRN